MKYILVGMTLFIAVAVQAQVKTRTLEKVMELQVPGEAISGKPGTRGASVAWHPVQKKYYAAMAGNIDYPMTIFDATGKRVSSIYSSCKADTRGLWYNPVTKSIQGNGYDTTGWFSYKLDGTGTTLEQVQILETGMHQPGQQLVGAFNPAEKTVLFLSGDTVISYKAADRKPAGKNLMIRWGISSPTDETSTEGRIENYNYTTIIYTGLPNAQLGFLNFIDFQVELYNQKTGLLTQVLKLPEGAPAETSFNFAYANGLYWFFNMTERKWIGYK
ncbi:MAG TPA: hypothetical protein PLO99_06365 [Chitinophagaceae bacterium]|nr:hypothetical protein [Chitinophagaceae bacterium]HRG92180.1 hypothetical protein [Chitinophagaceae bacterium]